jgi:hypothetical protein
MLRLFYNRMLSISIRNPLILSNQLKQIIMAQFTLKHLRDAEIALGKALADEFYYDHDLAMKCDQLAKQIKEMADQVPPQQAKL